MAQGQKESPSDPETSDLSFVVEEAEDRLRLDVFLAARLPGQSRSRIQAVIKAGGVSHAGRITRASEPVRTGEEIRWREPAPVPDEHATAEDIALEILHEDADLIVLHKPAGMVVHPGAGNLQGTLVSALLHHCGNLSTIGGVERPGIVHRLDKETSGCLVVAKNDTAHRSLATQFEKREVRKTYLAVVEGRPKRPAGTVSEPIGRHPVHRQKMTVTERGRAAVTEYKVLAAQGGLTLVECRPQTGRTHQIRVHLKHLGCPVAGDPVYGKRGPWPRHLLHAWKLAFRHPATNEPLEFTAPSPVEFRFS